MNTILRKFAYRNPRFGRTKTQKQSETYKNSPYYFWWEFLKRHQGYAKTCKEAGRGRYAALYADFGNIHENDFKTWWQQCDRGARLFAEQPLGRVQVLREQFQMELKRGSLIVELPLVFPKRYLIQQVRQILKREHLGKRGFQIHRRSTANYPITGHVDLESFDKALRVYDLRKAEPQLKLWELVQRTKAMAPNQLMKDEDWVSADRRLAKKLILANTASRLLKRAERMIAATGEGRFPR